MLKGKTQAYWIQNYALKFTCSYHICVCKIGVLDPSYKGTHIATAHNAIDALPTSMCGQGISRLPHVTSTTD